MNEQMIIICGAGYVSGKEIMALELAGGLSERDVSIEMITSAWNDGVFLSRLKNLGLPAHVLRFGFITGTVNFKCLRMNADQLIHWPGLIFGYRRILHRIAPARIIHTNWHHLLLIWPFLNPKRDLFWLHETLPNTLRYRRVFQRLANRISCFVAVSHAVARSLTEIGISPQKIRVIHNGLTDPCPLGGRLSIGNDHLRIGIVGQVGDWKGHEDMLEAFALTSRMHPTVELHVIGRGSEDYESKLKLKAEALGIAGKISWRGQLANRAEIYHGIGICVVPSRSHDPLPTVAIEAAFFGIPVIASRQGGLPEIVVDGETGFLVEAGRPDELAARLNHLVSSQTLRQSMGERARLRAITAFSRQRFLNEFTQLLGE